MKPPRNPWLPNVALPRNSGNRNTPQFREEVARETAHSIDKIQGESTTTARAAQAAAAESLKNELPRWLAPQLEQMTHELTAQLAREGALQREQHEKQLSTAHETLQTLCTKQKKPRRNCAPRLNWSKAR